MLFYQGKRLERFREKSGGKNSSDVDGFYRDSDNNNFFIKKPADKGELFAELFAGLILKEFMAKNLVDEHYCPSLICADVIRFDDGSYGLIQPLVAFDELHRLIGTSYSDGSDRDPKWETLFGPSYYKGVMIPDQYRGLSLALMFSLLLGAHSVHSGNIVALNKKELQDITQYGRIDWGDAFRYFAHEQNNNDILYAYENRGLFNFKRFTKDYFLNYKNIPGIFPAMAEKAQQLMDRIDHRSLLSIVENALQKIPADLLDDATQQAFAEYISMDSFNRVKFADKERNFGSFPEEMTTLLESRLQKISILKDMKPSDSRTLMYKSTNFAEENSQFIPVDNSHPLSEIPQENTDDLTQTNDASNRKYMPIPDAFELIQKQLENINRKAEELEQRNEKVAAKAARDLVGFIKKGMNNFSSEHEKDECVALNDFKNEAQQHINNAKQVLVHHRQEWKYILANLSLAILLLGVGYGAAALINRATTGNYTFFSKTDSVQKIEQLENSLSYCRFAAQAV